MDPAAGADWAENNAARFEFAPPRHFVLPAILLLLSEEPGYGYLLVKGLQEFGFGRIDRPSVYRALAQLKQDDLVENWAEAPTAGQTRQVYALTERGERVLRSWMGVIKDERACLDRVLRRYQATNTTDAALAEVQGAWASSLGNPWSPASSASPPSRRRRSADPGRRPATSGPAAGERGRRRYTIVPDRSVVLVEARSSVGPISFGGIGVTGVIEASLRDGAIALDEAPCAHVEIPVAGLSSGNSLYDAELLRRVDARRYPNVSIELRESSTMGSADQYALSGVVTFHGVTQPVQGAVAVDLRSSGKLVVTGQQAFDIRDFGVASPTVLMLRIYPDVKVNLHIEAATDE
jgi:DNA-binding PadR family transcriptional regulator/polyisoprenoid-binding protein YceI